MKKFLEGCPFGCFFVCDVDCENGDEGDGWRPVSMGNGARWCVFLIFLEDWACLFLVWRRDGEGVSGGQNKSLEDC